MRGLSWAPLGPKRRANPHAFTSVPAIQAWLSCIITRGPGGPGESGKSSARGMGLMSTSIDVQSKLSVGGVQFSVSSLSGAVQRTIEDALARRPTAIRLTNAYCVSLAYKDPEYLAVLNGPGITYPDGAPVAALMRLKQALTGRHDARRVRGPSFFRATLAMSQSFPQVSHFFLGGTEASLQSMADVLGETYPQANIAGFYAPRFGPVTDELIAESLGRIVKSRANIVWIGLGTPKQDVLAARLARRIGVPCVGVGAAFDYLGGGLREAPSWMRNSGTEWLFRLLVEPRRLWKRYLIGNFYFLIAVLRGSRSWNRR